jgi:hypothetical protein
MGCFAWLRYSIGTGIDKAFARFRNELQGNKILWFSTTARFSSFLVVHTVGKSSGDVLVQKKKWL